MHALKVLIHTVDRAPEAKLSLLELQNDRFVVADSEVELERHPWSPMLADHAYEGAYILLERDQLPPERALPGNRHLRTKPVHALAQRLHRKRFEGRFLHPELLLSGLAK